MQGSTKTILIAAAVIAAAALFLFAAFDPRLIVRKYSIESPKVSSPVRLLLITDLHSCRYGKGEKNLIDAVTEQDPDAVLFAGDICDDRIPDDNARLLLEGIAGRYPCYYVTGNHEYWSGRADEICSMLRSYGVTVLEGTSEILTVRGQEIRICGVSDPECSRYSAASYEEQMLELCSIPDDGTYTVLVAHRPERIEDYLKGQFDLVAAGHAHGGQWRIPLILNGL
ncbi:MAG: metallophosphoesterase [Oscillospiraceae bacterium]|jgi:predicted MPP superfamily phosphohydrolase